MRRRHRLTIVMVVLIMLFGSGGYALAQTLQPVQPLQPLATEVPDDRPGTIPTIDPDSDLPTRPSVPTPTPHPARQTPVPTSDNPLGGPTAVPVSTEPAAPTPTAFAPNPQPNQPTIPPINQPTPTVDPGATATLGFSAMLCESSWSGYIAVYDSDGELISLTPRPKAEWDQHCAQAMGPITFNYYPKTANSPQSAYPLLGQTVNNLVTFEVPAGTTRFARPEPGTYLPQLSWCTSTVRLEPFMPTSTGAKGVSAITLQPGEAAQCVRYFMAPSGTANLVITMHTCPVGYNPLAANADDPFTTCTPGYAGGPLRLYGTSLPISAWPDASSPDSVTFGMLSAFTYTVGIPTLTPSFTIGCHASQPLMMGPAQTIALAGGETRTCDWFVVPLSSWDSPVQND